MTDTTHPNQTVADDDAEQTLPDGSPVHWCDRCEETVPEGHEAIFHVVDSSVIEEHRTELRNALRGARSRVMQARDVVNTLRSDEVYDVELAEIATGPAVLAALDQALVLLAGVQTLCPDPVTPEA